MRTNKQGFKVRNLYRMWRICPKTGFKQYQTFLHKVSGWKLLN